jgi:hypothetical protein
MRHIQTASTLGYAVHSTIIAAWALTAQKLRNLRDLRLRVNQYVPVFLATRAQSRWSAAERAIPLLRAASRTIEERFTRGLDELAVSLIQ